MSDAASLLALISSDIAALAPTYPQLAGFSRGALVSERSLSYVHRAAPDPSITAGWRRGYPMPAPGGVVLSIRLLTTEEHASLQQATQPLGRLAGLLALVHVHDGADNKPLAQAVHDVLVRHGYELPRQP